MEKINSIKVLTFMNAIHPTINFTFKYSKTSIDLLDTSIHIGQGGNCSPKYTPNSLAPFPYYLDFKSNHPVETKLSIIYSPVHRYRLLTCYDEDLTKSLSRLKLILLARGYPNHTINSKFTEATTPSHYTVPNSKFTEATALSQTELLCTHSHNNKNNPPPLPFVIPYHRENSHIKKSS